MELPIEPDDVEPDRLPFEIRAIIQAAIEWGKLHDREPLFFDRKEIETEETPEFCVQVDVIGDAVRVQVVPYEP